MRKWAIAPSAVLVALLASCSSQPAPPTPGPAPASAAAAAPTSAQVATTPSVPPELAAELGPRVELPGGLLRKEIGKTAMTTGSPYDIADWRLKVTVTGVKVDPKCARPNGPQRGHRAVVAVRVETSPAYTPSNGEVSYFNWSTISPDGVSEPAVSTLYECNETKELFTELRPASKYVGEITIDTANTSGYVVLGDSFAWPFPA